MWFRCGSTKKNTDKESKYLLNDIRRNLFTFASAKLKAKSSTNDQKKWKNKFHHTLYHMININNPIICFPAQWLYDLTERLEVKFFLYSPVTCFYVLFSTYTRGKIRFLRFEKYVCYIYCKKRILFLFWEVCRLNFSAFVIL